MDVLPLNRYSFILFYVFFFYLFFHLFKSYSCVFIRNEKATDPNLEAMLACEQALLFGQTKRTSRERASEGLPLAASLLARAFSRDSFIGELARRLRP